MQKQLSEMANELTSMIEKLKQKNDNKEIEADTGTEVESTQE